MQMLRWRIRLFGWEALWGLMALGTGALTLLGPDPRILGGVLLALLLFIGILWVPEAGLGLALIAGPFAPLENEIARPPLNSAQIFLGLALLAWTWRGLARRDLRVPSWGWGWAYGLYLGYTLLSLLWAASWEEGLPEWIKWAQIGLVVILVRTAQPPVQRGLLGAALLSGALQAGVGLWQAVLRGTGPEHFRLPGLPFYRAYGTFQQPNPFAGMMGLIAPVALGLGWSLWRDPEIQRWRWARPVGLGALGVGILSLLGLLASWSRGAWLGAGMAGLVLLLMLPARARHGLAIGSLLMLLSALAWTAGMIPTPIQARLAGALEEIQVADVRGVEVTEANFAVIERLAHWQAAVEMFQARPWLGVGFGNYAAAYPAYALIRWPNPLGHAHNIYLNVAAETGLIGLALYLLLWAVIGAQTWAAWQGNVGWRRGLAAGLMAAWAHLHVHHFFDNLYVANLPLLLALYGAWAEILISEGKPGKRG
jgi:putative inorganic carbon (HCO3(-)) transporter